MRTCEAKLYVGVDVAEGGWKTVQGKFHQWGSVSDENLTDLVGIVELPDGTVLTVAPNQIRFTDDGESLG